MRRIEYILRCICFVALFAMGAGALAQPVVTKDGNGFATSVKNPYDYAITIKLFFDDGTQRSVDLQPGETYGDIGQNCKSMTCNCQDWSKGTIYRRAAAAQSVTHDNVKREDNESTQETSKTDADEGARVEPKSVREAPKKSEELPPLITETNIETVPVEYVGWRNKPTIMHDFEDFLERTSYYSLEKIQQERQDIDESINNLQNGIADSKKYIEALRLVKATMVSNLDGNRENKDKFIDDFLGQYTNSDSDKTSLREEMSAQLDERLAQHEENLRVLDETLTAWEASQGKTNWPLIALIAGLVTAGIGLVFWYAKAKKKNAKRVKNRSNAYQGVSAQEASSAIVVRRKTTSILKKQSLENVVDNPAYMKIDCAEFCQQSAVRRIYIKNTCIKDIYNMYAEDLRNPENPKEDGCMVLGRWVHDKENDEYYVSLEDVVMPGDDAVFAEQELNFGGKIKLKVSERLRKLRRETDLQYDMTCWVHSHPGLKVFFSNQDTSVHMQLRHPTHPRFLTALVVDILTPQQELGIFTFKPDGTINSHNDMLRTYSLEEFYKWAIESERNTFKREDHYNTLALARQHGDDCNGVHLSNGAIIDMSQIVVERSSGNAGIVHGFIQREGKCAEIAVTKICQEESVPDSEQVGCFIIAQYCSIPTVRRAVEPYIGKIRFALVYSAADGMVTTIPILNNELVTDESYYGEQTLEDLKIWTRRRR